MIRPAEIQQIARKEGVRDTQIEKDYILSWILIGIAHNKLLSDILAFKGGTVLRKFYFEGYRHSEDLDFTLLESKTNDDIKEAFEKSFEYVKEEANIPLSIFEFGEHETGNINFYISYTGALGGAGKRVKAKYKGLNSTDLENRLEQLLPTFKARWIGSMREQVRELPPFEQVARELGRHFRRLFKI